MVKQTALPPEDALHSFTCPLRLEVACAQRAAMYKCAFLFGALLSREQIFKPALQIEKFGITGNPIGLHVRYFG